MQIFQKLKKYYPLFTFAFGIFISAILNVTSISAHGIEMNIIRACVNNHSGEIHIVFGNKKCGKNERILEWNKEGKTGPQGPIGPQGIQGLVGPQGPSGSSSTSSKGAIYTISGSASTNFSCSGPVGSTSDCYETEIPIPKKGKLVSLAINPYRNSNTTGGPAIIEVLLNGIPSALQVQIVAGSTTVKIASTDVPVLAGDLITIRAYDLTGDGDTRFTAVLEYATD